MLSVLAIEIIAAQLLIRGALRQQMTGNDQNAVPDRHQRTLLPEAGRQARVLGSNGTVNALKDVMLAAGESSPASSLRACGTKRKRLCFNQSGTERRRATSWRRLTSTG